MLMSAAGCELRDDVQNELRRHEKREQRSSATQMSQMYVLYRETCLQLTSADCKVAHNQLAHLKLVVDHAADFHFKLELHNFSYSLSLYLTKRRPVWLSYIGYILSPPVDISWEMRNPLRLCTPFMVAV